MYAEAEESPDSRSDVSDDDVVDWQPDVSELYGVEPKEPEQVQSAIVAKKGGHHRHNHNAKAKSRSKIPGSKRQVDVHNVDQLQDALEDPSQKATRITATFGATTPKIGSDPQLTSDSPESPEGDHELFFQDPSNSDEEDEDVGPAGTAPTKQRTHGHRNHFKRHVKGKQRQHVRKGSASQLQEQAALKSSSSTMPSNGYGSTLDESGHSQPNANHDGHIADEWDEDGGGESPTVDESGHSEPNGGKQIKRNRNHRRAHQHQAGRQKKHHAARDGSRHSLFVDALQPSTRDVRFNSHSSAPSAHGRKLSQEVVSPTVEENDDDEDTPSSQSEIAVEVERLVGEGVRRDSLRRAGASRDQLELQQDVHDADVMWMRTWDQEAQGQSQHEWPSSWEDLIQWNVTAITKPRWVMLPVGGLTLMCVLVLLLVFVPRASSGYY